MLVLLLSCGGCGGGSSSDSGKTRNDFQHIGPLSGKVFQRIDDLYNRDNPSEITGIEKHVYVAVETLVSIDRGRVFHEHLAPEQLPPV